MGISIKGRAGKREGSNEVRHLAPIEGRGGHEQRVVTLLNSPREEILPYPLRRVPQLVLSHNPQGGSAPSLDSDGAAKCGGSQNVRQSLFKGVVLKKKEHGGYLTKLEL
jgi:hypothetical protein